MRELHIKTDKNLIHELPRFVFEGRIIVIQSEAETVRAVKALRCSPILGIDTETRPTFRRGETHKVSLLQIADEHICFLFRLNEIGFPQPLVDLLADRQVLKVGLSLHDDFMMLRKRNEQFTPKNYIDLQDFVKEMGIEDMSLQKLYANVFRKRISKSARLSNWEADVLSESQKQYAATKAIKRIQLYKELKELKESGEYILV